MGKRGPHAHNPARERAICDAYGIKGATLETVGDEFGITRERVRQILVKNLITVRFYGRDKPEREARRAAIAEYEADRRSRTLARRKLKREKIQRVRKLYDEGAMYWEIALLIEHSINWVQAAVAETGGPNRFTSAGRLRTNFESRTVRREVVAMFHRTNDAYATGVHYGLHPETIKRLVEDMKR